MTRSPARTPIRSPMTDAGAALERPVVLVGMMGAGKSTVGRRVAVKLGRPFADTDALIEAREGQSIAELFATRGEPAFRDLEAAALRELVLGPELLVLATGGGAVVRPANRALLREHATVVWLRASAGVLAHRVRQDGSRPLLADDPRAAIDRLLAEREPWYREVADHVVDVDHVDKRDVIAAVVAAATGNTVDPRTPTESGAPS